MNPPSYRPAACCLNCFDYPRSGNRCLRHGVKVDMEYVCDTFLPQVLSQLKEEETP